MADITSEKIWRVINEQLPYDAFEVSEDQDGLDMVEIRLRDMTTGKITNRISMSVEIAEKLAPHILDMVEYLRERANAKE